MAKEPRGPKERPAPKPTIDVDALYVKRALTDARRELDPWRQGCLVSGMRLFWAAPGGHDIITGVDVGTHGDEAWNVTPWDGERAIAETDDTDTSAWPAARDSQWGVIVSQTCDIMAIGPGSKHPTVQVAPLRRLTGAHDPGEIARIQRHQVIDYHYITNPPADEGDWAVDMRISLPVSKAVLLGQDPVSAFNTAREEHDFTERYAAKSRRPSLHDEVSTTFVDKIRDIVKQAKSERREWPERVEQFRFVVHDGDKLQPRKAELLVLLSEFLHDEDRRPIRDVVRKEQQRLAEHGIVLAGAQFQLLGECKADLYRRSDPLYVPELGRGAFW